MKNLIWYLLNKLYYRHRIKRRLREIKTGAKRSGSLLELDPISPEEMMDNEPDNYNKIVVL